MKRMPVMLCIVALAFSLACKKAAVEKAGAEQKLPEKEQEVEIQGEVFVVTKGAQNIKLGLVDVIAIPEEQIAAFLKDRKQAADAEAVGLEVAYNRAESEARRAEMDMNQGIANYRAASERNTAAMDKVLSLSSSSDYQSYYAAKRQQDEASRDSEAKAEKADELAKQYEIASLRLEQAKLRFEGWPTAAFIFQGLPSSIGKATTNADGKFSLKLPRKGRYAIAAHAERKIIDDNERYYWLIWVPVENGVIKNIVLSNNNMMTVQSAENVMQTALSDF